MSGIFLLGVLALWFALVVWIAYKLTQPVKRAWLRTISLYAAIILIFPLIVIDELITAPQFAKLCEEGTKLRFDPEKIRGRTIFLAKSPSPKPNFSIGALSGYYIPSRYLDATTKEELIAYESYFLEGGIFIRTLGISEGNAPLTMRSYCAPKERPWQKIFLDRFSMNYIEEKDIK